MFRGANKVTLDAKGRMAMPARYRDTLVERSEGRLVATVDRADRCLLIYPLPDWEEIERKLVKIAGRKPVVGRPFLYATTREFLTLVIEQVATARMLDPATASHSL